MASKDQILKVLAPSKVHKVQREQEVLQEILASVDLLETLVSEDHQDETVKQDHQGGLGSQAHLVCLVKMALMENLAMLD